MNEIQALIDDIKVKAGITDPATIALVERIVARSVELGARAMAGEDISKELAHLNAQRLNLQQHVQQVIGTTIFQFVQGKLQALLFGLLL